MRCFRVVSLTVLCIALAGSAGADVSFELQSAFGGFGIGRESFDRPVDVVQDRDENVYVVDQGNNRVQVLDRRGNFVREWGGRGFSPGAFDHPVAIIADKDTGNLFVVDKQNHRIQKFDTKGKLLLTIGRLGSSKGDLNAPMDVALDKKGSIYVADTGNNRIQKFDPSGKFVAEWGRFARRGMGAELVNPVSVAYSEEGYGYIYVLNSPECRVLKYELDGTLAAEWPMHKKGEGALCGPSRIRIEPRKYTVYIADTENDRVTLFDRNGEHLGDLKEGKVRFRKPGGVSISDLFGEEVVVADTGNNLIQKFRRSR
ncbi:MAG: NHL repeat-containing protein [Deltaproteobacteria bacterium]|nr:NHL repeat-containing protein [Deltaproteobacteria bacterium]